MVSINWCLKQEHGLKLIEPNENMSQSYIKMAEESINVLPSLEKSRIWTAATSYYIFYYSLYSLMLRIGVKCEIHTCSIEFMKTHLHDLYSKQDIKMLELAFGVRIDLQYYADRPVDEEALDKSRTYCKDFFIRTKDILSKINDEQIDKIRKSLKNK